MADWADERARTLADELDDLGAEISYFCVEAISAALREALARGREKAIEECAQEASSRAKMWALWDREEAAAEEIADAILALKEPRHAAE